MLYKHGALLPRGDFSALGQRICRVIVEIAGIELEAVHAKLVHKAVQLGIKPLHCGFIGEVQYCRCAVPPADGVGIGSFFPGVCSSEEEALALHDITADKVLVHAHERANPQHELETHCVEFVAHGFGVGETSGMEYPFAIVFLPGVVNHDYPRRKSVVQNSLGISKDPFLILVVHEFDPGVVLGHFKKLLRRHLPIRGEVL